MDQLKMPPVHHYNVYFRDKHNGGGSTKVGEAKTKKGAQRSVDKRDNEYGAYAHYHKPVFADTMSDGEEVNEISIEKAKRYLNAADQDFDSRGKFIDRVIEKNKTPSKTLNIKQSKRIAGIHNAMNKIYNTAKIPATNEEKVDEISSNLARSYFSKAVTDKDGRERFANHIESKGKELSLTHERKLLKRERGIRNAEKKLYGKAKVPATNEEEVNEISKDKADTYFYKAIKDQNKRMKNVDSAINNSSDRETVKKLLDKHRKRSESMSLASDKRFGSSNVKIPATNEEINEISSKALGSYINKSAKDIDKRSFEHGLDFETASDSKENIADNRKREEGIAKRRFYIKKAADKLVSRSKE